MRMSKKKSAAPRPSKGPINHQHWLELAQVASERSQHPTVKVGAIITTPDGKHVLSDAANNPPNGIALTPARLQHGSKSLWFMCAEKKALARAQKKRAEYRMADLKGCRIYSTLMPCHTCAHDIIEAGLQWVCVPEHAGRHYPKLKRKYRRSMEAAEEMFAEKGIKVVAVPEPDAKKSAGPKARRSHMLT